MARDVDRLLRAHGFGLVQRPPAYFRGSAAHGWILLDLQTWANVEPDVLFTVNTTGWPVGCWENERERWGTRAPEVPFATDGAPIHERPNRVSPQLAGGDHWWRISQDTELERLSIEVLDFCSTVVDWAAQYLRGDHAVAKVIRGNNGENANLRFAADLGQWLNSQRKVYGLPELPPL